MNKLKKGDEVIIIAGRDKGKRGTITQILAQTGKLVVEGINLVKKHVRPNPNTNDKGGIVLKTHPIQASNVMLYDTATQKGSKVGIRILENGKKVRYFKSTNEIVDVDA